MRSSSSAEIFSDSGIFIVLFGSTIQNKGEQKVSRVNDIPGIVCQLQIKVIKTVVNLHHFRNCIRVSQGSPIRVGALSRIGQMIVGRMPA
jgi:hypothetical protein